MLDPDPDEMNADPQPCLFFSEFRKDALKNEWIGGRVVEGGEPEREEAGGAREEEGAEGGGQGAQGKAGEDQEG